MKVLFDLSRSVFVDADSHIASSTQKTANLTGYMVMVNCQSADCAFLEGIPRPLRLTAKGANASLSIQECLVVVERHTEPSKTHLVHVGESGSVLSRSFHIPQPDAFRTQSSLTIGVRHGSAAVLTDSYSELEHLALVHCVPVMGLTLPSDLGARDAVPPVAVLVGSDSAARLTQCDSKLIHRIFNHGERPLAGQPSSMWPVPRAATPSQLCGRVRVGALAVSVPRECADPRSKHGQGRRVSRGSQRHYLTQRSHCLCFKSELGPLTAIAQPSAPAA